MEELFTNFATSTLASGITDSATSLDVATGDGALFPSPAGDQHFHAVLEDDSGNREIVRCTSRSGDTLTIERAQQGTSAQAWSTGDKVELRLTRETLQLLRDDGRYWCAGPYSGTNYYESAADALPGSGSMTFAVICRLNRQVFNMPVQTVAGNYRNFSGGGYRIAVGPSRPWATVSQGDGGGKVETIRNDWVNHGGSSSFYGGSLLYFAMTFSGTSGVGLKGYVNGHWTAEAAGTGSGYITEAGNTFRIGNTSFDDADPAEEVSVIGCAYTGSTIFNAAQIFDHFLACLDAADMVEGGLTWEHMYSFRGYDALPATLPDLIGSADLSLVGSGTVELERRRRAHWITG